MKRVLSILVWVALALLGASALGAIAIQRSTQFSGTETGGMSLGDAALLACYALFMLGVCMLACVVPTVRALRVQPTEALTAE